MMKQNIPVYIISYNKLSVLKKTIQELLRFVGYLDIVIIDNSSDYKPLIEYYKYLQTLGVTFIYNSKIHSADDLNTIAPFIEEENSRRGCEYYIVTDSDISLELVDGDLFEVSKHFLNTMPNIKIVGPMLTITDIPAAYPYREFAWKLHAEQFWHTKPMSLLINKKNVFYQEALVDTTFGMLKSETIYKRLQKGVRLYNPYEAQHLDWYISKSNMTDDQIAYFENSRKNKVSHWSSDSIGIHRFEVLRNKNRWIYIVDNEKVVEYELEKPNRTTVLIGMAVNACSGAVKFCRRLLRGEL